MMLVSLISYIDRNTLALLAPTMLCDLGLTAEQYGFVISAFSIAYMIGNPLWGHWLDRVGLRGGMTAAVVTWTAASVSHAFTGGFGGLAAARAALGFGEGATFPGALRTVVQTLPPASRSRGVALAYSGGSLGAVITPIIVTPIAVVWGWRAAFWLTGLVGLTWVMFWLIVSRRPDIRLPMARTDRPAAHRAPRWRDRRLWSFVCSYALGALPLGFVLYAAAIYLSQALGKTQLEIGKVLWIPPLGWEVGYFFWGYVTDRWLRADQSPLRVYRRLFTVAVVCSLPLALTARIEPYWLLLSELFFAMFVASAFVIISISYATAIYSPERSGFIAGMGAGSWSALVAVAMPVFGRFFDQREYETAFLLATGFPVVGYVLWLYLSREPSSRS